MRVERQLARYGEAQLQKPRASSPKLGDGSVAFAEGVADAAAGHLRQREGPRVGAGYRAHDHGAHRGGHAAGAVLEHPGIENRHLERAPLEEDHAEARERNLEVGPDAVPGVAQGAARAVGQRPPIWVPVHALEPHRVAGEEKRARPRRRRRRRRRAEVSVPGQKVVQARDLDAETG